MTDTVHIIATCTDRKSLPVPEERMFRAIPRGKLEDRVRDWWNRLGQPGDRMAAEDLYLGDHWKVVRELPKTLGTRGQLWVASAGYGLVPAGAKLASYSATLSPRQPDSVLKGTTDFQDPRELVEAWWRELGRMRLAGSKEPRTAKDLAGHQPKAQILVVASPLYVVAMQRDLLEATQRLAKPDNLMIVSVGSNGRGPLATHFLPAEARLKTVLKGAFQALNARVARQVLHDAASHGLSMARAKAHLENLVAKADPLPTYDHRHAMNDAAVVEFITEALKSYEKQPGWTPLLRVLRGKGSKCEQSRFKKLYYSVVGEPE